MILVVAIKCLSRHKNFNLKVQIVKKLISKNLTSLNKSNKLLFGLSGLFLFFKIRNGYSAEFFYYIKSVVVIKYFFLFGLY